MIVTLTPNTGIDYTLAVPRFELNATIRSSIQAWGMGGKATDVAGILGQLEIPVLALGFAAGRTGLQMEQMLQAKGVQTDFVWAEGETRLNVVVVCSDGSGQSTFTSSSLQVTAEQLVELELRYESALEKASCVVLGGSLPAGVPPEFYAKTIRKARQCGLPVIFDASGEALQAGVKARPSAIKPNREELGELLGHQSGSLAEVHQAARQLHAEYGADVIVTLGNEGAIAILDQRAYHIPALSVPVASSAGAGDGVLAGLALALARGEAMESGLMCGFALAGAIVQTLGTAEFRVEDYEDLLPQVELVPLS